jgi:hypothetical protein
MYLRGENARFWPDQWKQQLLALIETRKSEGNRFWDDKNNSSGTWTSGRDQQTHQGSDTGLKGGGC